MPIEGGKTSHGAYAKLAIDEILRREDCPDVEIQILLTLTSKDAMPTFRISLPKRMAGRNKRSLVLPVTFGCLLQGCGTAASTITQDVVNPSRAQWEYVEAGATGAQGHRLPAHVAVLGSRYEWSGIRSTRAVPGPQGRLLLLCDQSELRYEFGTTGQSINHEGLHTGFRVWRHSYALGEYVPMNDYVELDRTLPDSHSILRAGQWIAEGPFVTAAFVTAAKQGAAVDFWVENRRREPNRAISITVRISHRFSLNGFEAALLACDPQGH